MMLSGQNFIKHANSIFAQNYMLGGRVTSGLRFDFAPKEMDIVYCKTDYIKLLFEYLNHSPLKNIALMTHESDHAITAELFESRPACVKIWYGQNVDHYHADLKPLPIGLADAHCNITLKFDRLYRIKQPEKLLYINHRSDTSPTHRSWIYDYFKNSDWCTVRAPNLSLDSYREDLDAHEFILCPRGNGIDTHRCWEALYHGIIPIVQEHVGMTTLADLPALVVPDFKMLTREFLKEALQRIKNQSYKMNKLQIQYWIDCIHRDLHDKVNNF